MKSLGFDLPSWKDARLHRFLVVGGTCFAVNMGVLYVGTEWLGFHYLVSMAISIVVANSLGWALNRQWTFGATPSYWLHEYVRYFSVNLLSFGFSLLAMAVLVSGLGWNYLFASALLAAVMTLVNFVLHRDWSFRR